MKKIIYFLMILGATLTSCDTLDDIADDAGVVDKPVVGDATYILTSDDYDDLDLGFGTFGSEEEAKTLLPPFIDGMFPQWGEGSSVLIGYDLFIGNAEGVSDYSGADTYQLTNDDYASTGSDAFGFYPNVDTDGEIPAILDAAISSPVEDQIVLAKFDQYFSDPVVGLANVYAASFPTNYDDFENIDFLGDLGWAVGAANVQGSGFSGGAFANEDWLISPEIDLSGKTDLKFQINQEIDFFGAAPELIDIVISTDYTTGGDPMAATWTTFNFDKTLFGSLTLSEAFDFSAYDGEIIHVAFKYSSTDSDSPRWRVESFAIKTLGVDGDANNKGTHFAYSGSEWESVDEVYYLSSADFDSMGEASGQPGRFNNFGSSVPADDYLPAFLASTTPYSFGQEEDELIVVYNYFSSSSGAQIRGNRYTVIDGMWVGHERVISTTLQFSNDGSTWVPDNTIKYTLAGGDYSFIGDALLSTYPGPAGNVSQFSSFDRREGRSNYWSNEMLAEGFDILLSSIDPSAAEGQKYIMTFNTYIGSVVPEDLSIIKTGGVWVLN